MSWEKVCACGDLTQKQRLIFKKGPKQIVVVATPKGIFALDNRCPHQGYPLKEGVMDENQCVLTCNWHNWKFDLKTGKCVTGGDPVRVYPLKEQDGHIWIEIRQPSVQEIQAGIFGSIEGAIRKAKMGRLIRELGKLHFHGLDPRPALKMGLLSTAEQFSEGITHAHAAAADWLTLYESRSGQPEDQIICLAEAIDYLASSAFNQSKGSYESKTAPFSTQKFLDAVEHEDEPLAQALILGALNSGKQFEDVEGELTQAALMHYNEFGHSLIFVTKVGDLIRALGVEVEKPLLYLWVRQLCNTMREDLLPEFKTYAPALLEFPKAFGKSQDPLNGDELFQKPVAQVLQWVLTHAKQASPPALFEALVAVNAKNMLYFDATYQDAVDVTVNDSVGWLDFTHALTFAQAVWQQCHRAPQCWPAGLLQLACFAGRNIPYVNSRQDVNRWDVKDIPAFEMQTTQKLLDHGIDVPIIVAHYLKTTVAIQKLIPEVSPAIQRTLRSALNRFLGSPYKQKHIRRKVRQNMALISKDFA